MSITAYVVTYPNGSSELCHNFSTAQRVANRTPGARIRRATNADITAHRY